jgi:hypothetical protein
MLHQRRKGGENAKTREKEIYIYINHFVKAKSSNNVPGTGMEHNRAKEI